MRRHQRIAAAAGGDPSPARGDLTSSRPGGLPRAMDSVTVRGFTGPWFVTRLGYLPPHGTGAPK